MNTTDPVLLINSEEISRYLSRISYEIIERNSDISNLAIVGIRTGGEHLGKRIVAKIGEISGHVPKFGFIDITLYRDDLLESNSYPVLKGTDLPFSVSGTRIVLVDDVLFTGRTIRSALDAIIDFGRPKKVELAVLVDRGHRELPIRPDYVGKNIPTNYQDSIKVFLHEKVVSNNDTEKALSEGVYLYPNDFNKDRNKVAKAK